MLVGGGFRLGRQSMIDALRASLIRLQLKQVDLYQVSNVVSVGLESGFLVSSEAA